jgi:HK97 gp10 family phage protein
MMDQGRILGVAGIKREFDALPDLFRKRVLKRSIMEGARVVKDDAAANVRVKTGELRGQIKSRAARGRRDLVVYNVAVRSRSAHLIEFGTSPHPIAPRNAVSRLLSAMRSAREGAEAMTIGGRFVGGAVQHPGSRPFPFLRPALERNADRVIAIAAAALRRQIANYQAGKRVRL